MSSEGKAEALRAEAERVEKEKRKAATQERKAAAEAAKVARLSNPDNTTAFTGSLGPKQKSDLQDLAAALSLSQEGTKADLIKRITDHLLSHQDQLKSNEHFSGLYTSLARGQKWS